MDYTVETTNYIDEAVPALKEGLKDKVFSVLWNVDLSAKLNGDKKRFSESSNKWCRVKRYFLERTIHTNPEVVLLC